MNNNVSHSFNLSLLNEDDEPVQTARCVQAA